jgi:PAS domain S-box-containing protein
LGELSSLLLVVFVIDAAVSVWRKGKPGDRRSAVIVCGSIAFFILLSAGLSALINHQVVELPYWVSFPFAATLAAMAFELGSDLLRAAEVAEKLRLSEASLHESETRFRLVADAAPVPIWMSGPDKLCTFFNTAWLDFTGRTMEQELGNGWSEGVHPDDLEESLQTYVNAFEARNRFVMQYRLRHQDGEYRWITDTGAPRYDERRIFLGYIGACVDITELLEKDRALREVEQRVALAAEAAHMGVWELDLGTNKLWVSDKIRELFDIDPDEEVDLTTLDNRVHPEDRESREAAMRNAIETGGSYEFEFRVPHRDGSLRWLAGRARCVRDETGELTRLLGVSMEVTNRKQAEELFKVATEASPSGTLLVDSDGKIVLLNAHIEELFGYKRDELIGQPVEILVPHRYASIFSTERARFLANPERRSMETGDELFARRKDGSEFPVEIGLNPIATPRGFLVLASVLNISRRKAAEKEAQRQRDQIDLLSRLSLLGEMTASLAHELNQPLGAIMNNGHAGIRAIDRGRIEFSGLREILVDVVDAGQRAHDIIQNVRRTVKGDSRRERLHINEVILEVTRMVRADAAANSCAVRTLLAEDLPTIDGDPLQLQQVLVNLVSNAFAAMRDLPANQREIEIATEAHGDEAVSVSVRDFGPGISEEARGKLFEEFFTTKKEGLGMGLAIVRSFVEAHGGKINARNRNSGSGANFSFTIPISKDISE